MSRWAQIRQALAQAWRAFRGESITEMVAREQAALSGFKYARLDRVHKRGGDYQFHGWVVSAYAKLSGAIRYDVENPDGLVHIFNEAQLHPGWPTDGDDKVAGMGL